MSVDVSGKVARARAAQPAWAALSYSARARCLRSMALRLRDDAEVIRAICVETGKPEFEALAWEVGYVLEWTRFITGRVGRKALAERVGRPFLFPWKRTRVRHLPRGVVAVIGPWNFPLLNNYGDAIAPLLAGNSVVLKPSPFTAAASRRVAALWGELGLPADVFQVVEGDATVGAALVDSCDMVFFTGSVAGGKAVAQRAASRLIPCVTELGGKSAFIVLEDADLDAAATSLVWGALANAGQVCIRPERILVVESVADAFVAKVVAKSKAVRLGPDPDLRDIAPVLTDFQVERALAQLHEAVSQGAQILCGVELSTPLVGRSIPPTVVDRVPPQCGLSVAETFTPIIPIIRVRDEREAVAVANDSVLGLAGYVFSRDPRRARAIARSLKVGTVGVNDVLLNFFCMNAPLGGYRESGLGFRNAGESLLQFCHPQTTVENRRFMGPVAGVVRNELAFPYKQRTMRIVRWLLSVLYRR